MPCHMLVPSCGAAATVGCLSVLGKHTKVEAKQLLHLIKLVFDPSEKLI